jgi:oligopeptide transport system permease protein
LVQNKTLRRFLKNKAAVIGAVTIIIFILIAVFAYALAPDNTPYANRQLLELNGKGTGLTMQFLKFPKSIINTKSNWDLINGREDAFNYIPIKNASQKNDSIIIEQYIDEDTTVVNAYHLKNQLKAAALNEVVTTKNFYLGTDKLGRDILSRLIIGTRVSLMVGLIAVLISLSVGIALGLLAGYFGGMIDAVIMWFINVVWSIPTILLVFAFTVLLGKGEWQVFVAVGLTMWVNVARLVRGQVLEVKNLQYIEAAKVLGFSHFRIMLNHILPNILGPIMVLAAANFATAIVLEAGLSFLGIGVQAPKPSWGLMIKENYNLIITNNALLALAPGFAIMLMVLAFNMLGNGLRDAFDVKG